VETITAEDLCRYVNRPEGAPFKPVPRIKCASGLVLSVQVGSGLYCTPRVDHAVEYTEVEVGFPSSGITELMPYAEGAGYDDPIDYVGTVYPYVPIEIVVGIINRHGGCEDIGGPETPSHLLNKEVSQDTEEVEVEEFNYSHNNSGGVDWLGRAQWDALLLAGWEVRWRFPNDRDKGAYGADKEFATIEDAKEEWTRLTGGNLEERGCDCCGPPHHIY
jgi:hypothetical protein